MEKLIKLIASDILGSSGYYPAEVLRRDGAIAFPKGTKILDTHIHNNPVSSANMGQGVSARDAFGEFLEDAYYDESGIDGAGLYARVLIYEKVVEELGEDRIDAMMVSIFAGVEFEEGEIDGQETRIITKLLPTQINTVDIVVFGGADGRFVKESVNWCGGDDCPLFPLSLTIETVNESGAIDAPEVNTTKGNHMTLEEAKQKIADLERELETLNSSLAVKDAELESAQTERDEAVEERDEIAERYTSLLDESDVDKGLSGVEFKSAEAKSLVRADIIRNIKRTDDGVIDKDHFAELLKPYTDGTSELVVSENDTTAGFEIPKAMEWGVKDNPATQNGTTTSESLTALNEYMGVS